MHKNRDFVNSNKKPMTASVKRKPNSFDKERLIKLSKPRRINSCAQQSTPKDNENYRNPFFISNLKFNFKLPNVTSKHDNERYIETLQNVSKAKIYGIKLTEVPNLQMQFSHYRRLLDEKEKYRLKRVFANIDVDSPTAEEEIKL